MEIKSVEAVTPVHKQQFEKQLLTHLRLADKQLALLINFNVALIKNASCVLPMGCRTGLNLNQRRQDANKTVLMSDVPTEANTPCRSEAEPR